MGFFDKIKKLNIFSGFSAIDDDFYDELEETLILSDMGMDTTLKAVEELKSRVKGEKIKDEEGSILRSTSTVALTSSNARWLFTT